MKFHPKGAKFIIKITDCDRAVALRKIDCATAL